ncbi:sulfate adenylyltransferase subunit CysN [Buchnera aphidicola (Kurisakia onigurumii)]|uniref:sulfate adenylyltransferase subunit CysN n=1 Tax=Buchnera aphidicola TaxID=9 RepID=UPI0031B67818
MISNIQKEDNKFIIKKWLHSKYNKNMLRFLTCGSVDDGKSTLIGRLLHDSKQIYSDQLDSLYHDSKKHGTQGINLDLSLLVDGLQAEREQGITIDVAYRYFSTNKRKFIIADTPGHSQYTCNMVTGASLCELSILLIDVRKGILKQTYRHAFISNLLGIRYLIVTINKMDLVNYDENKFNEIKKQFIQFSKKLSNVLNIYFVPISALTGENVVVSNKIIHWYNGPTLLDILENIQIDSYSCTENNFIFPIQYINRPNLDFRGYSGSVVKGIIKKKSSVKILPSNEYSKISEIITYDGKLNQTNLFEPITITLQDNIDISRGDVLVNKNSNLKGINKIIVTVVWMSKIPLMINKNYNVKIHYKQTRCYIKKIFYKINIQNLEKIYSNVISLNEIGVIEIYFDELVVCDTFKKNKFIGSMIFIDSITNLTVGAGMIKKIDRDVFLNTQITYSNLELDLNNLVRKHFPHWNVKNISLEK